MSLVNVTKKQKSIKQNNTSAISKGYYVSLPNDGTTLLAIMLTQKTASSGTQV